MPIKLLPAPRIQNAIYTSEVSRYMILEERIHFLGVNVDSKDHLFFSRQVWSQIESES